MRLFDWDSNWADLVRETKSTCDLMKLYYEKFLLSFFFQLNKLLL